MSNYEDKTYLGYVYDSNGYHNGAIELQGVNEVANFVCDVNTINNNKVITDILDELVFNTIGYFVDRFGNNVSNDERRILLSTIMTKQEELFEEE